MATLTARPRRIDLDDQGEFKPDDQTVPEAIRHVPGSLRPGGTVRPAYVVVYDQQGTPICRMNVEGVEGAGALDLHPGTSMRFAATLQVDAE